ncbi:hypothetical protein CCC_02612 [Paramagnetospirillum magnetotacticum MS-1]|uniref:DUF2946 domain-containing protein n=1 Tax=Paramagnetospirillum magnetotacticum MS-1 TaxID=272627 RepID=A0A0C2YXI7_PARME|nr:hypothetical protein CCC_02612 [Paramagnetospirillum magnetotacticum MS-1]
MLVLAVAAWSGAAQADETAHHPAGAHADHSMPCHPDGAPAPKAKAGEKGCCLFSGCAAASIALPGMTEASPVDFTVVAPVTAHPQRLVTQAQSGPPAEPPRT